MWETALVVRLKRLAATDDVPGAIVKLRVEQVWQPALISRIVGRQFTGLVQRQYVDSLLDLRLGPVAAGSPRKQTTAAG